MERILPKVKRSFPYKEDQKTAKANVKDMLKRVAFIKSS